MLKNERRLSKALLQYRGTENTETQKHREELLSEAYCILKGDNELWMSVTESFGGWGIIAEFENLNGLRIKI